MSVEGVVSGLRSIIRPITAAGQTVSRVVLFLMMLLTMADVLMRKLLDNSILGTVELTELMMILLIFLSLAHTEFLGGHVKVDILVSRLGPGTRARIDAATQLLCSILFGLMTWAALAYAAGQRVSGEVTQDLWLPIWPFIYILALGCALLCLTLLLKFLTALLEAVKS